jgi:hypothetical protein
VAGKNAMRKVEAKAEIDYKKVEVRVEVKVQVEVG